jgi:hypothetical protein
MNQADTPQEDKKLPDLYNRPGRDALAYRIGTHADFLRRMLARLPNQTIPDGPHRGTRPLAVLATHVEQDPAAALLDAWATVADVFTFYQERIVNEGYLRTAIERRSLLELARAIGYQLEPAVAATVYLAFTVQDGPGALRVVDVPAGTQVQSVPAGGDKPQTFETAQGFQARVAWNALRPHLSRPQTFASGIEVTTICVKGANLGLKAGDPLLLVFEGAPPKPKRIQKVVEVNRKSGYTCLELSDLAAAQRATDDSALATPGEDADHQPPFAGAAAGMAPDDAHKSVSPISVYAFKTKLGFFGHNAPFYNKDLGQLNDTFRALYFPWDDGDGLPIWKDSVKPSTTATEPPRDYVKADVFLERSLPGVQAGSWVLFAGLTDARAFQVDQAFDISQAGFATAAKVTGLKLKRADGDSLTEDDKSPAFTVRTTNAYVQSEPLDLVEVPISSPLEGGQDARLELDRNVTGLQVEQHLMLSGQVVGAPQGEVARELVSLTGIDMSDERYPKLTLAALQNDYVRSTVELNANVVRATHGETVHSEVLGSGDGSQARQRFALRRPPLTYLGKESTLQVRVNGVQWQEALSLFDLGARQQGYVVRVDEDGSTWVIFGDGQNGARLPSGVENVVASYRSGAGREGNVGAGSLSLLKTRPPGIKAVTNPQAAYGGADRESLQDVRARAPMAVAMNDRLVSLRDFADFAFTFPGVRKARAILSGDGVRNAVHITVAGDDGEQVATDRLLEEIRKACAPGQVVQVENYEPLFFRLEARVRLHPRYEWEAVQENIRAALFASFAFDRRRFGQRVYDWEVIVCIQGVEGVDAVELEALYVHERERAQFLKAEPTQLLRLEQAGITLALWEEAS